MGNGNSEKMKISELWKLKRQPVSLSRPDVHVVHATTMETNVLATRRICQACLRPFLFCAFHSRQSIHTNAVDGHFGLKRLICRPHDFNIFFFSFSFQSKTETTTTKKKKTTIGGQVHQRTQCDE